MARHFPPEKCALLLGRSLQVQLQVSQEVRQAANGDRAFFVVALKFWNLLPREISLESTLLLPGEQNDMLFSICPKAAAGQGRAGSGHFERD